MKHVIIGTAGHVDHGKTALVKALTGIDTDRLEEEKRRGVTIEPGFAYIDFDDGSRAGIIDVPGHERFIRNMLAGSGGIDLAMLVVAADEGVMPQTREHLGILTQLGIGAGLVVVTKSDKVERDWLDLVMDDISELVSGSFLDGKAFLPVSAYSGEGIAELRNALRMMIDDVSPKDADVPFRLPIDRVFPVDGFGIVVTGTLIAGSVKTGDAAEILPGGEKASIRSIQVHGADASVAYAGQRTAISLAGVKSGNVRRGDVLTAAGMLNVSHAIDVKLSVLPEAKRTIKNGAELHFYHGAKAALAKAYLLDKSEIAGGEYCYARLRLKEPLPCRRGDRFVVRFFSPLETIGGGIILDSMPENRISRNESAIAALKIREKGSDDEVASLAAYEIDGVFSEADLCRRADLSKKASSGALTKAVKSGGITDLSGDKFISSKLLKELGGKSRAILKDYHMAFPLRAGMSAAELRQKLIPEADVSEANAVLKVLETDGIIKLSDKTAALPDFSIGYTPGQTKIHEKLQAEFLDAVFDVKSPDELLAGFPKNEKKDAGQVFESMISSGEVVMLSQQVYWLRSNYEKAIELLRNHFSSKSEISLAECRDMLGTSRKYALAFLEHLDGKQVTKMRGDVRVLTKGPDAL